METKILKVEHTGHLSLVIWRVIRVDLFWSSISFAYRPPFYVAPGKKVPGYAFTVGSTQRLQHQTKPRNLWWVWRTDIHRRHTLVHWFDFRIKWTTIIFLPPFLAELMQLFCYICYHRWLSSFSLSLYAKIISLSHTHKSFFRMTRRFG